MNQKPLRDFQELCMSVGRIVILWALAEQALNGCISAMFEEYGGKALDPDPPRSLKKKIAFARKCLRAIPSLAKYKDEGLTLMQRFSDEKGHRHDLVHASLEKLKNQGGAYGFIKLDHAEGEREISRITIHAADFPRIAVELEEMGKDAIRFGLRLLDERPNL